MGIVSLDYDEFRDMFAPNFASSNDAQIDLGWLVAQQRCNNTDNSKVTDLSVRKTILYLITAHVITSIFGNATQGAGSLGAIVARSQGSESAQAQIIVTQANQWWISTTYGANALQMLLPYAIANAPVVRNMVTSR